MNIPVGEVIWLTAAVAAAGVLTGMLAGLFGIGGGAVIVPVLFEVFRVLGVPEDLRMQLCIGTSLAIIVPTTVRSYWAHRTRGHGDRVGPAHLGGAVHDRRRDWLRGRGICAPRACSRLPSW